MIQKLQVSIVVGLQHPTVIEFDNTLPRNFETECNLRAAGFAIYDVKKADQQYRPVVAMLAQTPTTDVLTQIHQFEEASTLPEGALNRALIDVMTGDFTRKWGHLYTELTAVAQN